MFSESKPETYLAVLSSDEDEIDEENQDYLERLQDKVTSSSGQLGFNVTGNIQDANSDDDEDGTEYDPAEETALESYTTPLDSDDTNQDEYVVFKEIMQSRNKIQEINF